MASTSAPLTLPVLPLDDEVVLPGMVVPLDLNDTDVRAAVEAAQAAARAEPGKPRVLLVSRIDGTYASTGVLGTVAMVVVVGGLLIISLAGYALSRLRWRGLRAVFTIVLLLMLVPFESVAVPLFYMFNAQRNTLHILALPFIANAFSVYQFHAFFSGIPRSVEEAARIDGAGPWRTLFSIVAPMSRPVFASVAVLTFLTQWGSFLWPVLMISDPSVRPLPLEMSVFQSQEPPDWGQILAFGVLLVAPVLVMFAVFQRWFVQGVASAAV